MLCGAVSTPASSSGWWLMLAGSLVACATVCERATVQASVLVEARRVSFCVFVGFLSVLCNAVGFPVRTLQTTTYSTNCFVLTVSDSAIRWYTFAGIANGGSNALNTTVNSTQQMPASSPGKYKVTGSMGKVPAHLVCDFTFSSGSVFVEHSPTSCTLRLLFL